LPVEIVIPLELHDCHSYMTAKLLEIVVYRLKPKNPH